MYEQVADGIRPEAVGGVQRHLEAEGVGVIATG